MVSFLNLFLGKFLPSLILLGDLSFGLSPPWPQSTVASIKWVQFPLASVPLASVPLASIPLASVRRSPSCPSTAASGPSRPSTAATGPSRPSTAAGDPSCPFTAATGPSEFRNCPRWLDGFSPAQLMFGRHMRTALPAAAGAFEPIALEVAEEARKKTHEAALADIGNRRLDIFHEGDDVWVQNCITGIWDKDAVVLGQRNGGASFSIYFPESKKISWRYERFLCMKKSGKSWKKAANMCRHIFFTIFCIFLQIKMRNSQKTVYHYSCCNISVPFHYCPPALYMEREGGGRCPFPPFPPCFHPAVLYCLRREKSFHFLPSLPVSIQTQSHVLCCTVTVPPSFPLLWSKNTKKKKGEIWKTRNRKEKRFREKLRNTWNCIFCAWRCNPRCGTRGRCIERKERECSTFSTDLKR